MPGPRGDAQFSFRHAQASPLGRVTEAGLLMSSRGPANWRVLGRYALVYTLAGRAVYRDRSGFRRHLVPGDALLVLPELEHHYAPEPGEDWSEFYLIFEGPVFDLWRRTGLLEPANQFLNVQPIDVWLRRLQSVPHSSTQPSAADALAEVCRLQCLLADMMAIPLNADQSEADTDRIRQACALLESDRTRALSLHQLARNLGMSYESFRKKFVQTVGLPPARFRGARLVDRACELIQTGKMSDKEIAAYLGFCDEFHFSRKFKQVTGTSPSAFRRQQSVPGHAGRTSRT